MPTPTGPSVPTTMTTGVDGDSLTASLQEQLQGAGRVPGEDSGHAVAVVAPPLVDYLHAEICGVFSAGVGDGWPCSDGRVLDHSDLCGTAPVILPLWRRIRDTPLSLWGDWSLVSDVTCGSAGTPSPEQVLAEFRRLPITPSVLHVQPDRGWVLVNKETIAYTDPTPQTLSTTVLGTTVTFTVTPATFTWDYGEEVFTTSTPGHPYPDQDVSHTYQQVGTGSVTLVTTWQATYTTGADPTPRPVPGTASTTTAGPTFDIVEVSAHLTRGDCTQYPDDPGC